MHDMPVIQMQITRMAETINHAFVVHHKEIQEAINEGVASAIRPANIQRLIDEECAYHVKTFVREKVRRHPRWLNDSLLARIKEKVADWATS